MGEIVKSLDMEAREYFKREIKTAMARKLTNQPIFSIFGHPVHSTEGGLSNEW